MNKPKSLPGVIEVGSPSASIERVIEIADRNAKFLGHFPASCFRREAERGHVLAFVGSDGVVQGFTLYRTTRDRAVVQQLCVDEQFRGRGVARALADELKARTKHLPYIMCHCAHEYEALAAWQKLGFVPRGEKDGRGRSARSLVRLVFDHGHRNLFSESLDRLATTKLVAALDTNVFLAWQDADGRDPEIEALQADWLADEVGYWLTDETSAELMRQKQTEERRRRLAEARGFDCLPREHSVEEVALRQLETIFGASPREQDKSDHRQLSQAVAGGADVFVTRDERLLGKATAIQERLSIEVLRPSELILTFDQVVRAGEYAPERLGGCLLLSQKPRADQLGSVVDRFLNTGVGESKWEWAAVVRSAAIEPEHSRVMLVSDSGGAQRGLLVLRRESADVASVQAVRVFRDRLSETLMRHVLQSAVRQSIDWGCVATVIRDPHPISPFDTAAEACGFVKSSAGYVKAAMTGCFSANEAAEKLGRMSTSDAGSSEVAERLAGLLPGHGSTLERDFALDGLLWPAILRGGAMPCFVVPIRPRFARHLFDHGLSEGDLFGGDPSLLLNTENVYYRSAKIPVVTAPSRILWYVTKDGSGSVREVRACSTVLAASVAPAKTQFKTYRRLGVYSWDDVLSTSRTPDADIMAIHFGRTRLFPKAIPSDTLRPMICRHRGSTNAPPLSMPVEVPSAFFEEVCDLAFR
ncbi:MAG: GNAT family N-acetyltransferase [Phycisphaerales bacterium]